MPSDEQALDHGDGRALNRGDARVLDHADGRVLDHGDGRVLAYGGGWLDRASGPRTDPGWLAATLAGPDARLIPLWQDRCLASGDPATPVRLAAASATELLAAVAEPVFLGLDGPAGVFAVDLSPLPDRRAMELTGATAMMDVRALVGGLTPAEAAIHAYARGILHWHRNQRFCGTCGSRTEIRNGGHLRACAVPSCARLLFPRIEPAVIMLVEAPGDPRRCLLVRHRGAREGAYSTLAGFVEVGETLEDAVRRELAEEAGVRVSAVRYHASQAWPFPAGLMVGFRVVAASDAVEVDDDELVEARWFTREQLLAHEAAGHPLGRVDSIDRDLLRSWIEEGRA